MILVVDLSTMPHVSYFLHNSSDWLLLACSINVDHIARVRNLDNVAPYPFIFVELWTKRMTRNLDGSRSLIPLLTQLFMLSHSSPPSKRYIDMPHSSFQQLVKVIGCNPEWSSLCRLSFFFFLEEVFERKVHLHREEQNKTLKLSFQYMA